MIWSLIPWRVWLYAGLVVAALGVVAYYHHSWYDQGYDAEKAKIEAANKKANDDALTDQKNVDACYAAGGDWNRDRGVCDHPAR